MKNYIDFFCLLIGILLIPPVATQAQTTQSNQEITIRDTRNFVIRYFQKSDVTNITITIEYKKNEGVPYTINLESGGNTSSFTLQEPLNLIYFQNIFNQKLNEIDNKGYSIIQASSLEIFLWMYSLTDILAKAPLSGRLLLNTHIIILPKDTLLKQESGKTKWDFDTRANRLNKALGYLWEKTNRKQALYNKLYISPVVGKIPLLDFSKTTGETEETIKQFSPKSILKKPDDLDEDVWADVKAYESAIISEDSLENALKTQNIYPIKKVSLQLERGFLERIQVWITIDNGRDIIFENIYAIGFSSVKNFRFFDKMKLVPRYGNSSSIFLSDVFSNYDNFLDNYTRDYSPADTTINSVSPAEGALIELRRERYVNLFDSKIYTDLNGINQDSPNGLVQLEVSRRFNLKTSRQPLSNVRWDYGFLSYLNAYGSVNKIEKDQKYLKLRNENIAKNGVLISPSYATNLDFRRYENFSLGVELNSFLLDWPDGKMTGFFDFGARYGHTPVSDYIRQVDGDVVTNSSDTITRDAHSFTWYPRFSLEIFAEKRVGLTLAYQFNRTALFSNNEFKQVKSYAESDLTTLPVERAARKSHMVEFYLRAETSRDKNGRLFLRARFFIQQKDSNTFFPQFQLGYAYNLLFRN